MPIVKKNKDITLTQNFLNAHAPWNKDLIQAEKQIDIYDNTAAKTWFIDDTNIKGLDFSVELDTNENPTCQLQITSAMFEGVYILSITTNTPDIIKAVSSSLSKSGGIHCISGLEDSDLVKIVKISEIKETINNTVKTALASFYNTPSYKDLTNHKTPAVNHQERIFPAL